MRFFWKNWWWLTFLGATLYILQMNSDWQWHFRITHLYLQSDTNLHLCECLGIYPDYLPCIISAAITVQAPDVASASLNRQLILKNDGRHDRSNRNYLRIISFTAYNAFSHSLCTNHVTDDVALLLWHHRASLWQPAQLATPHWRVLTSQPFQMCNQ